MPARATMRPFADLAKTCFNLALCVFRSYRCVRTPSHSAESAVVSTENGGYRQCFRARSYGSGTPTTWEATLRIERLLESRSDEFPLTGSNADFRLRGQRSCGCLALRRTSWHSRSMEDGAEAYGEL